MPHLAIHVAIINPAGPAPTIRTSHLDSDDVAMVVFESPVVTAQLPRRVTQGM
jgi:hypothetical protein